MRRTLAIAGGGILAASVALAAASYIVAQLAVWMVGFWFLFRLG